MYESKSMCVSKENWNTFKNQLNEIITYEGFKYKGVVLALTQDLSILKQIQSQDEADAYSYNIIEDYSSITFALAETPGKLIDLTGDLSEYVGEDPVRLIQSQGTYPYNTWDLETMHVDGGLLQIITVIGPTNF